MDHSYEWTKASPQTARTSYTYFDTGWIATATEPVHTRAGTTERVGGDKATYTYYETGDQGQGWVTGKEGVDRREVQRTIGNNGTLLERLAMEDGRSLAAEVHLPLRPQPQPDLVRGRATSGDQAGRTTFVTNDELDRAVKINEAWSAGKDTTFRYDQETGTPSAAPTAAWARRSTNTRAAPEAASPTTTQTVRSARSSRAAANPSRTVAQRLVPVGPACLAGALQRRRRGARRMNRGLRPRHGTYEYADDGRLTKKTRTPRTGNADTDTFAYDTNGNRTKDERGTHTFNARDQLTSWVKGTKRTRYKSRRRRRDPRATREYKIVANAPDEEGEIGRLQLHGRPARARRRPSTSSPTAPEDRWPTTATRPSATSSGSRARSSAAAHRRTFDGGRFTYDEFDRLTSTREPVGPDDELRLRRARSPRLQVRQRRQDGFRLRRSLRDEVSRERPDASNGMTRSYDYDADLDRIGFSSKASGQRGRRLPAAPRRTPTGP